MSRKLPTTVLGRDLSTHLFWSVRDGQSYDPRITIPTVKAGYGMSLDLRGKGIIHRLQNVAIAWSASGTPMIGASWCCGGSALGVALVLEPEDETCPACGHGLRDGEVVYFAHKDGLVKIGYTSNVGRRMVQLGADLLHTIPGDRGLERQMHHRFRSAHAVGEWFRPTDELMEFIGGLAA